MSRCLSGYGNRAESILFGETVGCCYRIIALLKVCPRSSLSLSHLEVATDLITDVTDG
ncbi:MULTISPECIES: hypothetical protein [unclassified Coleofasciculus]|uniref:hypothetical protein n=1 Tax=unclassified Coleofasciculus TaxID=2692782 RepID=UPI001882FAB7|nr:MULTISPECIES: hypothetical protein [unclassified Coleofasciculus]MBE9151726.1 hypothetical protein [Coleofasciculus sp. LEGE 07092]